MAFYQLSAKQVSSSQVWIILFSLLLQMFASFYNKKLKNKKGTHIYNLYSFSPVPAAWEAGRSKSQQHGSKKKKMSQPKSQLPRPYPLSSSSAPGTQASSAIRHSTHIYCPSTMKPAPCQALQSRNQQDRPGPLSP